VSPSSTGLFSPT